MKMNKIVIVFCGLGAMVLSSCWGNKTSDTAMPVDSVTVAADTVVADTLEQLVSETQMPKAADELFDDFVFNFAANRKLQRERIAFPLPVTRGEHTESITKDKWKTETFFMHQGYYTLIFNNRKQMDRVKDTTVSQVVVKKIFLDSDGIREYVFDRKNGLWMMTSINNTYIAKNNNASFIKFYKQFAADPEFQVASIDETVKFIGSDPDDDFATMEGILTPDTWPAFAPELPHETIYNIQYGDDYPASNFKIFLLRGISNGFETELTFQRKSGGWKVTSLIQ